MIHMSCDVVNLSIWSIWMRNFGFWMFENWIVGC